jgi:diketogulonate reductase-like aldo/keto reductase
MGGHAEDDAALSPLAVSGRQAMTAPDLLRYTRIPLSHGGGSIPALGFGTLITDLLATPDAVRAALRAGFRHLDCAERYRNEEAVGDVLREAFDAGMLLRDDVFVTAKLWNNNHRPERVRPAFEASRRRLRLEYVDCYMVHTPYAFRPGEEQIPRDGSGQIIPDPGVTLRETWGAMESLMDDGHCRSLGLSNVSLSQLREIVDSARIKPALVQVESHPYMPQREMLDYCRREGIVLVAYAALGHARIPRLLDDPVIAAIARRVHKTPAQVLLAWAVQRGTAPLTTSTKVRHIEESFDVSALPEDALQQIQERVTARVQFNVLDQSGGLPGFIPEAK